MLVTSSCRVEILNLKKLLDRTLKLSRSAVGWLYPVIDGEWEILSGIQAEKYRFNTAEKLIHTTKEDLLALCPLLEKIRDQRSACVIAGTPQLDACGDALDTRISVS